ncbi:MAG: AAA family ATPase [Bryobacterales bacterium]|nr:AAA family ATPase [Bryobacterales bacterium]
MRDPQNVRDRQRETNWLTYPTHGRFMFRNIGPIHHAEMELGDLTIIAGHNNTGKTYLAYSIYGFLKSWNQSPHLYTDIAYNQDLSTSQPRPTSQEQLLTIDRLLATTSVEGHARESMSDEQWNRDRRTISNEFSRHFSKDILPDIFSVSPEVFKNSSVTIDLFDTSISEIRSLQVLPSGSRMYFSIRDHSITLQSEGRKQPIDTISSYQYMRDYYIKTLFPEFQHETTVFSSERFSISLFYRELDFTRNHLISLIQRIRHRNSRKGYSDRILSDLIHTGTSQYARPIRDNIDYTRSIPDALRKQSDVYGEKLHSEIEQIVKGSFVSEKGDLRFKSTSDRKQKFDLPLHMASSSARGMSDLYFFLRHVARYHQLLIIDEPESHLDTVNQVLLARLLSHFVRSGIRVLITTHSDYLLKEVNNLIMLNSEFKDKEEIMQDLEYSKHDMLDPRGIRGYIAEDRSLTQCKIDEYGVDWPVFDSTIDKINRTSNELSYRIRGQTID